MKEKCLIRKFIAQLICLPEARSFVQLCTGSTVNGNYIHKVMCKKSVKFKISTTTENAFPSIIFMRQYCNRRICVFLKMNNKFYAHHSL